MLREIKEDLRKELKEYIRRLNILKKNSPQIDLMI